MENLRHENAKLRAQQQASSTLDSDDKVSALLEYQEKLIRDNMLDTSDLSFDS